MSIAEQIAEMPAPLRELGARLEPKGRIVLRYRPSRTRAGDLLNAIRAAGFKIADLATTENDM